MIIYHGCTVWVEKPEIRSGDNFLDFGVGFYTTTSYEQAERWARIMMRRENKEVGYVSAYEFDYDAAKKHIAIFAYLYRTWPYRRLNCLDLQQDYSHPAL